MDDESTNLRYFWQAEQPGTWFSTLSEDIPPWEEYHEDWPRYGTEIVFLWNQEPQPRQAIPSNRWTVTRFLWKLEESGMIRIACSTRSSNYDAIASWNPDLQRWIITRSEWD